MDINNKVALLEELQEFMNSRKVSYIANSRLLDKIAYCTNWFSEASYTTIGRCTETIAGGDRIS